MKKTIQTFLIIFTINLSLPTLGAVHYIERVSVKPGGGNPAGDSLEASVSANGRYVAFDSTAVDLVAGDTNGVRDIFVYDRQTDTTTRVSVSSSSVQANGRSIVSDISDDGRYIVFSSRATNLTSDTYPALIVDPNNPPTLVQPQQIFLRDTVNNTTTLISKAGGLASSTAAANSESITPMISTNSQYVIYSSIATDLLPGDTDSFSDIYRYDILSGTTTLVSVNNSGAKGNAKSLEPTISGDGQLVAFSSDASNLGGPANDQNRDVFLRNISAGTTTPVTLGGTAASGFTDSQEPIVSEDGSFIVFESFREDLVASDNNGIRDIFGYDVQTGAYSLLTLSSDNIQTNDISHEPGVSSDGRFVIFESSATNLVSGDTNGVADVFVRDRKLGKTMRVSVDVNGINTGTNISEKPDISSNGRFIVFATRNVLTPDDSAILEDIYFSDRARRHDLDFSGEADTVWRNLVTGDLLTYLMSSTNVISGKVVFTISDLDWKISGIGDFNGDGKNDILWRHQTNGQNWMYLMDGATVISSSYVNTVPDSNWKVQGIGDFNGDGKDDILWRHATNGIFWMYLMDGPTSLVSDHVVTVSDLNWKTFVGDFNGDGKDDILWRHSSASGTDPLDGIDWMYFMNGITVTSSQGVDYTHPDWKISGIGDFNGDGKDDIFWRNTVLDLNSDGKGDGTNWMYLMNGKNIITNQFVDVVDPSWTLKTVADYDADGKDDIIWKQDSSGVNWMYLMDGPAISTSTQLNNLPTTPDWQLIGK